MSLPRLDNRMPITIPVIATHPITKEMRVVHVDVLWEHVIAIEEEPFPEGFREIVNEYGGVCVIRMVWGSVVVAGPFNQYHSYWCGYKENRIKEADKFRFYIPNN